MAEIGYTVLLASVALLWAMTPRELAHPPRSALPLAGLASGVVLAGAISTDGPAIGIIIAMCCGMLGGMLAVAIASTTRTGPMRAYLVGAVALALILVEALQ
ncbi:MAG TPA: hypothetical protein DCG06_04975 [Deltaproteobacteria bacterium]|nr:hypothetical protein [Deltaproteobacteria bacterium]